MTDCQIAKIIVTLDGVVTQWNKAAETLFGYSAAEMLGHPVGILGACTRRQKVHAIRRVRAGEVVNNIQTLRLRKDGHTIPVMLSVAPIKDEGGTVTGMDASLFEIKTK